MELITNIIKLQYLKDGNPSGIPYSYYTQEPVEVGDLVDVENKGATVHCIVTQINVPKAEIAKFKDRAKTIIGKTPIKEPDNDYQKPGKQPGIQKTFRIEIPIEVNDSAKGGNAK